MTMKMQEPGLFEAAPQQKPKPPVKPRPQQKVRGGYQPKEGVKPKMPTTGSGVKSAPVKKHEIVVHQPAPAVAPKSLLQVVAEAAANPAVDVQKMKELLAIQREMEQREAEGEFNEALARAKAKMPSVVGPDRKNEHTKSNYATLEKVSKTMDKFIADEGFTISYGMAESSLSEHYRITAKLSRGKFSRDYFIDLPADTKGAKGGETKTQVQGIGSTISYGRRYLKLMMFDVVVGREDDDGSGGQIETITETQADQLLRLCADKNIAKATFSKAFRVEEIMDLPASRFAEAKARLEMAPKTEPKKENSDG